MQLSYYSDDSCAVGPASPAGEVELDKCQNIDVSTAKSALIATCETNDTADGPSNCACAFFEQADCGGDSADTYKSELVPNPPCAKLTGGRVFRSFRCRAYAKCQNRPDKTEKFLAGPFQSTLDKTVSVLRVDEIHNFAQKALDAWAMADTGKQIQQYVTNDAIKAVGSIKVEIIAPGSKNSPAQTIVKELVEACVAETAMNASTGAVIPIENLGGQLLGKVTIASTQVA